MELNNLKPAEGSVKRQGKRVGRGQGSGKGGTATRGHNGAKSRSGYSKKLGFEGGQMPLQRRLPKRGFRSMMAKNMAEIRLHELNLVEGETVDLAALRSAGLLNAGHLRAKVVLSGELTKAVTLQGVGATKGAKAAIEAAGGKVED
jgi:large subunit ribosomal protein L15